jgi:hypothetical protein
VSGGGAGQTTELLTVLPPSSTPFGDELGRINKVLITFQDIVYIAFQFDLN